MLPVERLIGEEGLCASANGLRLAIRLPWYRSLPFSTVEVASLIIDDVSVDMASVQVEYDEHSWTLEEMAEQTDAFWFVRDSAFLKLGGFAGEVGDTHRVALTINVNPPYIPGMKRANSQVAVLTVN
jgi:hypothetical protein